MTKRNGILNGNICGAIIAVLAILPHANAANVVARPTATPSNRVSATRPTQAAARIPTMTINTNATTPVSTTTTATTDASTTTGNNASITEPANTATDISVTNKSSSFSSSLASDSSSTVDIAAATLAELVRAQRAALDAADASAVVNATPTFSAGTGENICDMTLRECMIQKCGNNFAKCAGDTDTTFFDKMDTCRRTTNCTGREYTLFSAEIKSDRDMNAKLANYNATIDCGNKYDACIVAECGATYAKCIGKNAGDTAIRKCESIAKSCTEYDSGLAMRSMLIFGELRQGAERQITADERRLYALREQMRNVCTRLGAMFDERSLDCVYTVNFRAGDDATLFASKKLYAGGAFDCTPNWFGIDITTFRENALRADREQKSASSAMLGSGLGQAAGALTSGAIDRAIARSKADNALEDAIKDCVNQEVDANGDPMTEADCRAKLGDKASTGKESKKDTKDGGSTGDDDLAYDPKTEKISGTVQDENGNALSGVTVALSGTAHNYITGNDGTYTLSPDQNDNINSTKVTFTLDEYENIEYVINQIPKIVKMKKKSEQ